MSAPVMRGRSFRRGYTQGWRWGAVCGALAGVLASGAIVMFFMALGRLAGAA